MNKKDLVTRVASKTGRPRKDVEQIVDAVLEAVRDALSEGEEVRLTGFGTFSTQKRAARMGRNPRTGQRMSILGSTTFKFKAARPLRESLQQDGDDDDDGFGGARISDG